MSDGNIIMHKGRPVPWITLWSNEQLTDPDDTAMGIFAGEEPGEIVLAYKNYPDAEREASGILWQREGIARGGEPLFAQVSTYRQRAAMRKRLCQVCGQKIESKVIRWLMAPGQLDVSPWGEACTMNAPTCNPCLDMALEKCPHLIKAGHFVARVLEYELWGVFGEGILYDPATNAIKRQNHLLTPYNHPLESQLSYSAVLAKQQMVQFTKFTMED